MLPVAALIFFGLAQPPLARRAFIAGGSSALCLGAAVQKSHSVSIGLDVRRRVLVAGATGRTGRFVVDQLAAASALEPIAGIRGSSSSSQPTSKKQKPPPRFPPGTATLAGLDLADDDPGFQSWLSKELLRLGVTDVVSTFCHHLVLPA